MRSRMLSEKPKLLKSDEKVMLVLDDFEPHDRTWICKHTQMKRTTVFDTLQRLIRYGYIEEWQEKIDRGRPKTLFCKIIEDADL